MLHSHPTRYLLGAAGWLLFFLGSANATTTSGESGPIDELISGLNARSDIGAEETLGNDIYGVINNIVFFLFENPVITTLIAIIFMAGGIWFIVAGLLALKGEERDNRPGALTQILAGSALIATPVAMAVVIQTIAGANALSETQDTFNFGGRIEAVDGATTQLWVANLIGQIAAPLSTLLIYFTIVWGLWMTGTGLHRLAHSSNPNSPHNGKVAATLTRIVVGSVAASLPIFVGALSNTMFNGFTGGAAINADWTDFSRLSTATSAAAANMTLEAGANVNASYFAAMVTILFYGLIPFGLIAFFAGIRGLYLASDGGQQGRDGALGSGVKIIAGVLMVNMEMTSCAVVNTITAGGLPPSGGLDETSTARTIFAQFMQMC